jgi:hypothetical protein
MAVASHVYTMLAKSLVDKKIDLDTDTLKCMLLSAYTVGSTQDSAQYVADVKAVATEASGTGYTAGGAALTTVSFTKSGHVYTLDCDDVVWAASTISAAFAVFYGVASASPGDSTNPVIAYWDLGGTQSSTAASFTLTINASGLLTFTGS